MKVLQSGVLFTGGNNAAFSDSLSLPLGSFKRGMTDVFFTSPSLFSNGNF